MSRLQNPRLSGRARPLEPGRFRIRPDSGQRGVALACALTVAGSLGGVGILGVPSPVFAQDAHSRSLVTLLSGNAALASGHAGAALPSLQETEGDFSPLGAWSVRVDRVENPREDRLVHVYLTLRNDSTRPLMQTENISVLFEDSSGITVESGQGLKAEPGYPQLFGSPPPIVEPGREIRTKFVFDRNRGASAVRVTVQEGQDYSADFEF